MKKLLWIGDAVCDSGFSRVTHEVCDRLKEKYSISILGLNYRGDPHPYPYPIYPAFVLGCKDFLGIDRISEIVPSIDPDIIVILNDPYNFPKYFTALRKTPLQPVPVLGIVAIDGKNCLGTALNGLTNTVFWTDFAKQEAINCGFIAPSSVIPLGVDLDIYRPQDQRQARAFIGFNDELLDKYVVGNVNRNQPRKRLDLTIDYFCKWVKDYNIPDAYLFVHVCPTGEVGYDCAQLMKYYGLNKRLIRSQPGVWKGLPQEEMASIYSCFDVQVSTTQGEGFGLTTLEGMACGIPQIIPHWSALGEWATAASRIRCTSTIASSGSQSAIGGVPDRDLFIKALDELYRNPGFRSMMRVESIELAHNEKFRWSDIANKISLQLEECFFPEVRNLETVT